jgi:hypothetical protein
LGSHYISYGSFAGWKSKLNIGKVIKGLNNGYQSKGLIEPDIILIFFDEPQ